MIECIEALIGRYLVQETLQPFVGNTEIHPADKFPDEFRCQFMSTVKYEFDTVTRANIENFRDVKAVFEVDQPAFQLLIANYQIPQILQIHMFVGECYDFEILQGFTLLTDFR